jgi:ADP-ribose pyrophosphatase YjhB (NUDIX family)
METLLILRDFDFGIDSPTPDIYKERVASRAIVFDNDGNIAVLHATNHDYHKLPGGGVEEGESIASALIRELQEEIGCSVDHLRECGTIEEYRNRQALHQVSHCFLADLSGPKGVPRFTDEELEDGFMPVWMSIDEAIRILESRRNIELYEGKYMVNRDLTFLKRAKLLVDNGVE